MTIQEIYNKYKAGGLTEGDFMWNIRRNETAKQFISQINSTSDVISILKQRGIISENISEAFEKFNPLALIKMSPANAFFVVDTEKIADKKRIFEESPQKVNVPEDVAEILQKADPGLPVNEIAKDILTNEDWLNKWKIVNPQELEVIDSWRKQTLQDEPYSIYEAVKPKLTADNVNYYEYTFGWRHEMNNIDIPDDPDKSKAMAKAKEIALKNLAKSPNYYSMRVYDDTVKKQKEDTVRNDKLLKMTPARTSPEDKKNYDKQVKDQNPSKANVKASLGNQERAKGKPKGVKVMKLKEAIRGALVKIIAEDSSYNNHIEVMRDMVKMKPEDLAKQVSTGIGQMSKLRREFAGKVLGKAIADGNKSTEVKDAFHKVSDSLHENEVKLDKNNLKKAQDEFIQYTLPEKEDIIKQLEKVISSGKTTSGNTLSGENVSKAQSLLSWMKDNVKIGQNEEFPGNTAPEKVDPNAISSDLEVAEVKSFKYNAKKNDYHYYVCEIVNGKIIINEGFTYENDAKDRIKEQKEEGHTDGKTFKVFSERFLKSKGVDPDDDNNWHNPSYIKEKQTVSKAKPHEGLMHKLLGLNPEDKIESKYKSGEELYNALMRKIKDHGKVTKMLAYAANISKKKDVFDAALHYAKKHNPSKK